MAFRLRKQLTRAPWAVQLTGQRATGHWLSHQNLCSTPRAYVSLFY